MTTGVITLHFGEPAEASEAEILPFLERIFRANASLEDFDSEDDLRIRSRELARRRAPGLLEEYRAIGGSPLNDQARAHADALRAELRARGHDVRTWTGMQFTEPFIEDAVDRARKAGIERLAALPVYPLCGQSTTVAALETLAAAVRDAGWNVELHEVSGWHRHPEYIRLRADNIRGMAEERGLDLADAGTRLVFSAHGTPVRYLERGNRYDRYVTDCCAGVAGLLGVAEYAIGFQNHENRRIPWTEPDVEKVVREADAARAIVVPISFMHEQSETLSELDIELRREAEEAGVEFHRVPVPHDHPRFAGILADLVEPFLDGDGSGLGAAYGPCRCRATSRTRCLNGSLA